MNANETSVGTRALRCASAGAVPAWGLAIAFAVFGAAAFHVEFRELYDRWTTNANDSHGVLVAPLVVVLLWVRRDRIATRRGGEPGAALALVVASVAFVLARAASVDLASYVLVPLIAWLGVWIGLGRGAARGTWFPFAYLLFAIPVWELATPVLQSATVRAVHVLLAVAGLQANIAGNTVTVPAGVFEIAGDCSGTNYLVVALAIATVTSYIERLPRAKSVRLVTAAATIAIASNWIRVAVIIYVGNATGMSSSLVADHYAFGWWLFAAAMVPLFWYSRLLARTEPAPPIAAAERMPLDWRVATGLLALAIAPAWSYAVARNVPTITPVPYLPTVERWQGPQPGSGNWRPVFPGAVAEREATYRRGSATVDAYVAAYGRQERGRKLIGFRSRLAGAEGTWATHSSARRDPGGGGHEVDELEIADAAGRRRVVWSWYEVRGQVVLAPSRVKLLEALAAFGAAQRSGVVALSAECVPDCAYARAALGDAFRSGYAAATAGTAEPR